MKKEIEVCALKMKIKCKAKLKKELKSAIFNLELAARLLRAQAEADEFSGHSIWVYEGDVIDALIHLQKFMKANKVGLTNSEKIKRILDFHTKA